MAKSLKKKPGRPKISKDDHRPKKKRTRNITEEQREALRQRMVEMRKKRKPAEYKNIHHTVLSKPENDKLSMKNVKEWIKEAKSTHATCKECSWSNGIKTHRFSNVKWRCLNPQKAYNVRNGALSQRSGDWIAQFYGCKK